MHGFPLPKILVTVHNVPANGTSAEHVRVGVHEPKERNKLDYSLKAAGSAIMHFCPADSDITEFVASNFFFQRHEPTPYYRITPGRHIPLLDDIDLDGDTGMLPVQLPRTEVQPALKVYLLGTYVHEGQPHRVYGVETIGCHITLNHPDRRCSVMYHLSTARGCAPESFLEHLHVELTKAGFVTLFEKLESKANEN